jgi:hypothetical protein
MYSRSGDSRLLQLQSSSHGCFFVAPSPGRSGSCCAAALLQIADDIRDKPTVPADPEDAEVPWRLALRDDLASHLLSKHCAFRGCDWTGNDDASLYAHVAEEHGESMARGAERFILAFSVEERMEAVYNEAVAEK